MRLPAAAAALVLTVLCAAIVRAAEPVKITDEKDVQLLKAFLKNAEGIPAILTAEYCKKTAAEASENYTWMILPQAEMLITAYQLTGDPKWLDLFTKTFEAMRSALTKDADGYWGWLGRPYDNFVDKNNPDQRFDVIINSYSATNVLSEFLAAVAKDRALAKKYEKERAEYLDLIENHLVKKWDARGDHVDLGPTGAIYRANAGLQPNKARLTLPHNKHSIIVRGLLGLYDVTGKDEYLRKAVKLGTRFKHCLTLKDGHYEWNYWDPAGAWDVKPDDPKAWKHWIGPEHKGHYYSLSLSQAVVLYQHSVVFTRADIDRFVKTQLEMTWNGSYDEPKWFRVDHSNPPKYTEGVYICPALAAYSDRVERFLYSGARQDERIKGMTSAWQGGPVLKEWLRGKYLDLPAARAAAQRYAAASASFLKSGVNQDFLKSLAGEVTAAGYQAPQTPLEMNPLPPEPAKK